MRRSKYGNVKVKLDGYTFDSKLEAERYRELKLLHGQGAISFLSVHPAFELCVNHFPVCRYVADFKYVAGRGKPGDPYVIEDCKGVKTAAYQIKKKLMKAIYGIEVQEITKCKTRARR